MRNTVSELHALTADNKLRQAIDKLRSIFALADSELYNDAILLSARFSKMESDIRKGIFSSETETLVHNRVVDGILSLIGEIKEHPGRFEQYDEIGTTIQQDAVAKTHVELSSLFQDALVQRLAHVKSKNLSSKALWIDDNPRNHKNERQLLESIGLEFDNALNSEQAWYQVNTFDYDLIISDFSRKGAADSGMIFLRRLIADGPDIPLIFYVRDYQPELGTPPYAFGITDLAADLLHYVMDVVERKY
ncbi:MAG: hypothetical protein WBA17_00390 [Saprospiraceae bacterium]